MTLRAGKACVSRRPVGAAFLVPPFPVGGTALPAGLKTRGYFASTTLRCLEAKPAAP
jgi:hypothetical protein